MSEERKSDIRLVNVSVRYEDDKNGVSIPKWNGTELVIKGVITKDKNTKHAQQFPVEYRILLDGVPVGDTLIDTGKSVRIEMANGFRDKTPEEIDGLNGDAIKYAEIAEYIGRTGRTPEMVATLMRSGYTKEQAEKAHKDPEKRKKYAEWKKSLVVPEL